MNINTEATDSERTCDTDEDHEIDEMAVEITSLEPEFIAFRPPAAAAERGWWLRPATPASSGANRRSRRSRRSSRHIDPTPIGVEAQPRSRLERVVRGGVGRVPSTSY
jgi:hypothetical protein